MKIDPVLYDRLNVLIRSMGYELVGCDLLPQGRQATFRVYIDQIGGVTIDDCSKVSHQISAMMDVYDPIQSKYTLEVSSPGIDRPLFEIEHYRQHIGSRIKVRLNVAMKGRRQYRGILKQVEGETICLLVEESGEEVIVPFSMVERANLIGDIHFRRAQDRNRSTES